MSLWGNGANSHCQADRVFFDLSGQLWVSGSGTR